MTHQTVPSSETLPADLRAGLVTFLVALPLCLGIALASGAPPLAGVIAGVIGGIVVGSLSGSSLSVSGPAAGLTTIVAAGILKLNSYETFLLAVAIAGLLQLGLGFARAGIIANYFPSSVIKGMLAAIGLTLILKQIPHALGWDRDAEGEFEFVQADGATTFTEIAAALANIRPGAVLLTLVATAILLLWQRPVFQRNRVLQNIPGALVAVLVGIGLNIFFQTSAPTLALQASHLVQLPIVEGAAGYRSLLRFPNFSAITNFQVLLTAVTIAVVASLETLLNVEATDKLDPLRRHTPPNRELKAQGLGNLLSGLLGGIPVTSVIVRSTVNLNAGARTKSAAVIHGILLLGCVLLIPGLLNRIPLAALAGILLFTGYKLTKPALYAEQWKLGWSQFLPFVVTIVAVLLTDLLIGIGIGLAVGIFFILRANYQTSHFFHREHEPGISDKIRISLADHVSFLNKASIVDILDQLPEDSVVEIDARTSSYVDHDVVEAIENFRDTARLRNIQLTFFPGRAGYAAMHPAEVAAGKVPGFETAVNEAAGAVIAAAPGAQATSPRRPIVPALWPSPEEAVAGAASQLPPPEPDRARYNELFANNRRWVEEKLALAPTYFEDLARGQKPQFLFIGCADSRVTIDSMTGTNPGEIFVHRNIANLVVSTDLNMLSVLQYAVEVLKVQHVIVLGHYGCGGVKAAMQRESLGLINKWLISIRDVMRLHRRELSALPNDQERFRRLVELNIQEQVYNLCKTSFVQEAWRGQEHLHVHGWVYDIREGLMRDLEIDVAGLMAYDEDLYRLHAPDAATEH
ncbi:MAG: carbonic anhydrase [Hymenobacteraceae bacterium]|nr:carbonic anhydrase [Hymenobacteraceae bacterium]